MANRDEIVEFLNQKLRIADFSDSSLNGLQVEGGADITRAAVAVDAGRSIVEKAAAARAELLIVHHGLFWGSSFAITGPVKETFAKLFSAQINLYAAHLPLDAHAEWGNNFCLARLLSLTDLIPAVPHGGGNIGCVGNNSAALSLDEMKERLARLPGGDKTSLALAFGPKTPARVCVCSGAAADVVMRARVDGFDTLITGEPRQFAYHYAKENNLNVIFGGHYATETVGVQEVGKALKAKFGLEWVFIDEPTGI